MISQNKQRSLACFKATTGFTVPLCSEPSLFVPFTLNLPFYTLSMHEKRIFVLCGPNVPSKLFSVSAISWKKIRNEFKRHQNSNESYQVSMNKKFSKSSKTLGLSFVSRLVQAARSLCGLWNQFFIKNMFRLQFSENLIYQIKPCSQKI